MTRNFHRLHVVAHPDTGDLASEFNARIAATPQSETVVQQAAVPSWWFLHHLVSEGFLLHGSNDTAIDEFQPRAQTDARGAPVEAVFATDDAIWAIFFAVVNRPVVESLINWCEQPGNDTSRYVFSIGTDPVDHRSWTSGAVYALPGTTFTRTPTAAREYLSSVAVRPRLRLLVSPEDFPLRGRTLQHRRGESVKRVWLRNALRLR